MFILSHFFSALATLVEVALNFYSWLIVARALISWVSPDPFNPIVSFLHKVTEPILTPIRRFLPMMAIDISPIIAYFIIYFLKDFLVSSLIEMAARLG